ncbi:hypothetical protein BKA82DRAFT_2408779 [Pisolithus tinctorius]|nr:hypothetical protein BKA82DRAFT_2408779 [Pisolithus tinctorius]
MANSCVGPIVHSSRMMELTCIVILVLTPRGLGCYSICLVTTASGDRYISKEEVEVPWTTLRAASKAYDIESSKCNYVFRALAMARYAFRVHVLCFIFDR